MKDVYNQKVSGLGAPISISIEKLNPDASEHGYFLGGRIVIGDHVPQALRPVILVHEMLHMVDQQIVGMGIQKRQIPHDWIINVSPLIAAFLIQAGFWKGGPTLKQLDTAMRAEMLKDRRAGQRRARQRAAKRRAKPPTDRHGGERG